MTSMVRLEGEYATQFQGGRSRRRWRTSDWNRRPVHFTALARVSDFEVVNFSGFGNATIDSGGSNPYFAVHQRQWLFHPAIALAFGSTTDISLGPVIQHSVSDSARSPYLSSDSSVWRSARSIRPACNSARGTSGATCRR